MREEQASQSRFFQFMKDAGINPSQVEKFKIVEGKEMLSDKLRASLVPRLLAIPSSVLNPYELIPLKPEVTELDMYYMERRCCVSYLLYHEEMRYIQAGWRPSVSNFYLLEVRHTDIEFAFEQTKKQSYQNLTSSGAVDMWLVLRSTIVAICAVYSVVVRMQVYPIFPLSFVCPRDKKAKDISTLSYMLIERRYRGKIQERRSWQWIC